ncbi:hypothetical protein K3495_g6844, partial [Podosphaera aphanis]
MSSDQPMGNVESNDIPAISDGQDFPRPNQQPFQLNMSNISEEEILLFRKFLELKRREESGALHTQPQATTMITRKETPWPCWNGSKESYPVYRFKLQVKIEEDLAILGSNRAICMGMVESLPEIKKPLVSNWFMKGGSKGQYDWREFLNCFDEHFESKQAGLEAGDILVRMRQGENQFFEDFIQDFENQLARCDGENWSSSPKLIFVHAAINEKLRAALVGKKLTLSMGYESWVSRVRQIAAQVEAMNSYRPNSSKLQTGTFFIPGRGTIIPHLSNSIAKQPLSDPDGDTIMSGVNALTAANSKGRNKGQKNSQSKPRAPWRSPDEFRKLLDKGLCTRCGKPG